MSEFSFPKEERLKSAKKISQVFTRGNPVFQSIIRAMYLVETDSDDGQILQVAFSVPKRKISSAVKRNHIKRRMKEVYRLNRKFMIPDDFMLSNNRYSIVFIYQHTEVKPYEDIERAMVKLMKKIFQTTKR